ncbi:MAG TPA: alpha-ribazole phosphatase family protein [Rhodocyclaceae bacterium]|nr:alpha-ribazole phosphatase family protein [Rhodocyclaceae bacterium]
MTQRLYLVRHAAVAVPAGVCYGRSDVQLAEPVAALARSLSLVLPPVIPVFTSPLSRCLLLAQAISALPVIDPRLAEMNFGAWEMQRFDDIPRTQIDAWAADPLGFRAPGGETGAEVALRAEMALAEIIASGSEAIIVSHGGPLRAIRGSLLGLPRETWLAQDIALGSLTVLSRSADQWCAEVST